LDTVHATKAAHMNTAYGVPSIENLCQQ